MKIICKDRRQKLSGAAQEGRGSGSVTSDVDRLLEPKSLDQLQVLEKQIRTKLASNEPIDVDYWERLLRSLLVWKARAKLRNVSQSIIKSRLEGLRKQQEEEASIVQEKLQTILGAPRDAGQGSDPSNTHPRGSMADPGLDPEPLLKLRPEDKALGHVEERKFLEDIVGVMFIVLRLCC